MDEQLTIEEYRKTIRLFLQDREANRVIRCASEKFKRVIVHEALHGAHERVDALLCNSILGYCGEGMSDFSRQNLLIANRSNVRLILAPDVSGDACAGESLDVCRRCNLVEMKLSVVVIDRRITIAIGSKDGSIMLLANSPLDGITEDAISLVDDFWESLPLCKNGSLEKGDAHN